MKAIAMFAIMMLPALSMAQADKELKIEALEIANSSSLSLLDNTSSIITSNSAVKEFGINTENLSNISFEYTLIADKSQLAGLGFYGLGQSVDKFQRVIFRKALRPTFSGSFNQNDSTAGISFGASLNILTVFSKNGDQLRASYRSFVKSHLTLIERAEQEVSATTTLRRSDPRFMQIRDSLIETYKVEKEDGKDFAETLQRPIITLDAAIAASNLYPTNKFDESKFDRLGIWTTLTWRPWLLDIHGFARYIKDDAVYVATADDYSEDFEFLDLGGKIELVLKKFSAGYEYIKREGDGDDYRSVGSIQYKISDQLSVTGGFGKNFVRESGEDLVSLFGVRWGFDKRTDE